MYSFFVVKGSGKILARSYKLASYYFLFRKWLPFKGICHDLGWFSKNFCPYLTWHYRKDPDKNRLAYLGSFVTGSFQSSF